MRQAMRVITKKDKFKPEKLSEQEASFAKRKKMLTMYEQDLENPVLVRNPQTISSLIKSWHKICTVDCMH